MAVSNFADPYITCCFTKENILFINLFYNFDCTHYHFFYNFEAKQIEGKVVKFKMGESKKNFPYKCFYNDENKEVYSFYRQG